MVSKKTQTLELALSQEILTSKHPTFTTEFGFLSRKGSPMVTEKLQTLESVPNKDISTPDHPTYTMEFGFIPIPRRLRYDPNKPFHFSLLLNLSFGFASTFVIANLYYAQPLLIDLSKSFSVSYNDVSRIPTLVQAGYATGVLFLTPLGDIVRRRQLVLFSLFVSASLTIGLAITNNLVIFETLSFFIGVFSITPQILTPLASDFAPPKRRASALSVVLSGVMLGILFARVLAGVIGQFSSWRVVYFMAVGLQFTVLIGNYLLIPDYPAKNNDLTYLEILSTMAKYAFTEPTLIQGCLINITSCAGFANYWVTLTFLLGSPPYNYSTLVIGLFGLIGMFGVIMGPVVGHFIDKLVPWYGALIATICLLFFQSIQTAAGGIHIVAVVVACFGLDLFRQIQQVSSSKSVFMISSTAISRLNALFIMSLVVGLVLGTSVGTKVFLQWGWRAGAGLNMAFYAFQLVVVLSRGPHCERFTWFGYQGGIEPRTKIVEENMRRKGVGVVGDARGTKNAGNLISEDMGKGSKDETESSASV